MDPEDSDPSIESTSNGEFRWIRLNYQDDKSLAVLYGKLFGMLSNSRLMASLHLRCWIVLSRHTQDRTSLAKMNIGQKMTVI